jgi:lipopolysaccharide transport system permease protein
MSKSRDIIKIDSKPDKFILTIREVIKYRDLFITLSWRDFKVRYAQTFIGLAWAMIQPIFTLLILSLVFGKFVGVKTDVPHIVFTIAGMCIWSYFSYVMVNSGSSIIAHQNMIKKIYFPRLIIPLSKAVVGFIDLFIYLLMMIFLMIYYKVTPSANCWIAPIFLLFGVIASIAMGIWLSALTIRYRDFQHIVPFLVQIGLYITPIAYPSEFAIKQLPAWASTLYYLNPMAGVIQGFRWCIFGGVPPGNLMYVSVIMVLVLLLSGLMYFNKTQAKMSDIV